MSQPARPGFRRSRTTLLYVLALLREFRWSLAVFCTALLIGAVAFYFTPGEFPRPEQATLLNCLYASWMTMLVQPVNAVPSTWWLVIVCGGNPLIGLMVLGEGVVRLALLLFSKHHGRKEWMRVMASTYRDHAVVCGIGKLGTRVIEQLVASNVPVVAVERDEAARFQQHVRGLGVPVIVGDMKEDQTLVLAGVPHARVVIIATNDDIANLEVALDSRRLNPGVRIVMRLFEQSIAQKISGAFMVDVAFSASTLAAPIVAAMSMGTKVLSSTVIAGIHHMTAELSIGPGSALADRPIADVERAFACRILARTPTGSPIQLPPDPGTTLRAGDGLVVHIPGSQLPALSAAGRGSAVPVG